jgi:hypothetical protein
VTQRLKVQHATSDSFDKLRARSEATISRSFQPFRPTVCRLGHNCLLTTALPAGGRGENSIQPPEMTGLLAGTEEVLTRLDIVRSEVKLHSYVKELNSKANPNPK